jgi:Family of unknown function (DUF6496)
MRTLSMSSTEAATGHVLGRCGGSVLQRARCTKPRSIRYALAERVWFRRYQRCVGVRPSTLIGARFADLSDVQLLRSEEHVMRHDICAAPVSAAKRKKAAKKYGSTASKKVGKVMDEMKHGTLKSGRSGKKVTSRKQAIAIGLSEARKAGGKVPKKKRKA